MSKTSVGGMAEMTEERWRIQPGKVIADLWAEIERLQRELAAVRGALPDADRLRCIAAGMRMDALLLKEDDPTCPLIEDAAQYLITAAARIREAQEAQC